MLEKDKLLEKGTVVVCIVDHPDGNESIKKGMSGVIVEHPNSIRYTYGVEWEIPIVRGHSLDGSCKHGYGWRVHYSEVEPAYMACEDFEAPDNLESLFMK